MGGSLQKSKVFKNLQTVVEIEYAGGPSDPAEGAWRDLREGQQGDEEQPGQGDDGSDGSVDDCIYFLIQNLILKASAVGC